MTVELNLLQLRAQAWEHLSQAVPQGVWIVDPDGNVVEASPVLTRWLERRSLTGTALTEHLQGKSLEELVGDFEVDLVSRTGLVRRVEGVGSALRDASGTLIGYVHVFTDQRTSRALEGRLITEIQRMAQLAGEDPLTGLANRRALDEALAHLREEHSRRFGVVVVDIDHFKIVNDSYGHAVGDEVLRAFADRLRHLVREGDLIARTGGDEFIVLMPNTTKAGLTDIADRLRANLTVELKSRRPAIRVYASVGYAHSGDSPEDVVDRADRWMYQNKSLREAGGLSTLARDEERLSRQ